MTIDNLIVELYALRQAHGGDLQVGYQDSEFFCFTVLTTVQAHHRGEPQPRYAGPHPNPWHDDTDLGDLWVGLS